MTEEELSLLKNKIKKAESLCNSISKIDIILNKLSGSSTACKSIRFEYYGESDGTWGMDKGEWTTCQRTIDSYEIGITEDEFSEWFTTLFLERLVQIKVKLQEDFDNLEIN